KSGGPRFTRESRHYKRGYCKGGNTAAPIRDAAKVTIHLSQANDRFGIDASQFPAGRSLCGQLVLYVENRRQLLPYVRIAGFGIAVIEQRPHVARVKLLVFPVAEIGLDIGQVEVDPVAFRRRVDAEDVVVSAVVDHRRDGPADDADEL